MGVYLGSIDLLGGGGGVNSYAPFLVGTTDNTPPGYVHSTGLYTSPIDDSVWLKTGNTVKEPAGYYPNAYAITPAQTQRYNNSTSDRGVGIGYYLLRTATHWTQQVGERGPLDDLYVLGRGDGSYDVSNVFRYEYSATPAYSGYNWEYQGFNIDTMTETGASARGLAVTSTHIYAGSGTNESTHKVYKYTTAGAYTNTSLDVGANISGWAYNAGMIAGIEADATHIYVLWGGTTSGVLANKAYLLRFTHDGTFVSNVEITKTFPTSTLYDISFLNSTDLIIGYTSNNIQKINATTGATSNFSIPSLTLLDTDHGFTIFDSDGTDGSRIAGGVNQQSLGISEFDFTNQQFGDPTARTDSSGSAQPLFIKLK